MNGSFISYFCHLPNISLYLMYYFYLPLPVAASSYICNNTFSYSIFYTSPTNGSRGGEYYSTTPLSIHRITSPTSEGSIESRRNSNVLKHCCGFGLKPEADRAEPTATQAVSGRV